MAVVAFIQTNNKAKRSRTGIYIDKFDLISFTKCYSICTVDLVGLFFESPKQPSQYKKGQHGKMKKQKKMHQRSRIIAKVLQRENCPHNIWTSVVGSLNKTLPTPQKKNTNWSQISNISRQ